MAANLELIIKATDQASGALDKIGKKAGAMGGAVKAGALAGVTAAAGLGAAIFKTGLDFDKAYDTIKIGTGATGKALEGLEADFKSVLSAVPTDMESASKAIADLNTRTGATGPALTRMAAQILELSRLTNTELGVNIEQTTRVMGDWGVSIDDSGKALDQLFKTSQATGPTVDTLSRLMVQFGAPMRQLGFDFDTTAALLGKFEREGVNTELVMGSMRIALGKMAREGEPAIETFKRVTDEIKGAGSASEANALALDLFGARAGPDMAAAIREGRFEVGALMDSIASMDGGILETSEATRDFGEEWQVFRNRLQVAIEPLASKLIVALSKASEALGAFMTEHQADIDRFVQQLTDFADSEVFPMLERAFAQLKQLIQGVIDTGIIQWIAEHKIALIALGVAVGALALAFGGPIIVIGTLIAAGTLLLANWDSIRNKVSELVADFQNEFPALTEVIETVFGLIANRVQFYIDLVSNIIEIATALWHGDFSAAWDGIKSLFSDSLGHIWEEFKLILNLLSIAVDEVMPGVKDKIIGAIEDAVTFVEGLPARMAAAGKGLANAIGDAFKGAWNKLANAINKAIPDSVGFDLPKVDLGFGLGSIGGGRIDINFPNPMPIIPAASGAVLTKPTLLLGGETMASRPEVVSPERLLRRIVREEMEARGGRSDAPEIGRQVALALAGATFRIDEAGLVRLVSRTLGREANLYARGG